MSKWNNILNKTRTEKTHVKRQRWHKRGVETAPCVLESEHGHTPMCVEPPGGLGVRRYTLRLSFSSPTLPSPDLPSLSRLSFPSLPLPSFSFGLDRLSRFVFLTITTMRWNFSKFQLSFQAHVTYASLCFLFACASSLTFLPVRLYYLRNPYAPSHFSHLVKKSPRSFSCIFSREGIWPMGCGLVPTRQISPLAVCPLLSSVSSSYRIPLRIIMPNTGISRAQVLATCSEWLLGPEGE